MSCPKGKIEREGYTATRKNTGKQYKVPSTCIKNLGAKGKGLPGGGGIGKLKPGLLSSQGYFDVKEKSDLARHRALMKVIRSGEPPLGLYRRLNALYVYTKRTDPKASKIYKKDRDWVGEKYGYGKLK